MGISEADVTEQLSGASGMKQYYVTKNGEQLGPFAESHIEDKVAVGELSAQDLCWTEGMEGWKPLHATIKIPVSPMPEPPMPTKSGPSKSGAALEAAGNAFDSAEKAISRHWWIRVPLIILAIILSKILGGWLFGS